MCSTMTNQLNSIMFKRFLDQFVQMFSALSILFKWLSISAKCSRCCYEISSIHFLYVLICTLTHIHNHLTRVYIICSLWEAVWIYVAILFVCFGLKLPQMGFEIKMNKKHELREWDGLLSSSTFSSVMSIERKLDFNLNAHCSLL